MLTLGGEKEKRAALTFDPLRDIDWQLIEAFTKIGKEILVLEKLSLGTTAVSSHE